MTYNNYIDPEEDFEELVKEIEKTDKIDLEELIEEDDLDV